MTIVKIVTVEHLRRFLLPFTGECPIESLFLEYTGSGLRARQQAESPATPTNSDYATALRIYKEWGDSEDISSHDGFFVWCKERLNASTHIA